MFHNILKKKSKFEKTIKVWRGSVCMWDDCTAPNEKLINVETKDKMIDIFKKVAKSLPQMDNVIWAIDSGIKVLGYIIMDENIHYTYELCVEDKLFSKTEINFLHCSHFHSNSFVYRTSENDTYIELYPESKTLLDKVKCRMAEKFQDEIKIKGGCIQIWGEWFGRPYDNCHIIQSIRWEKDRIDINFVDGESLYITNPSVIKNEEQEFVIMDASDILWVWYHYGKEQTYENLYVREYIKNKDGIILRAEGKREDVTRESGLPFYPQSDIALIIRQNL